MKTRYGSKIIIVILLFVIAILGVSLVFNKSEKNVFDNSDSQIEEVADNGTSLQLHIISGNKDSVFCVIERNISCYMDTMNYSYEAWSDKIEELYGTETCMHYNDYDYLNHECNIIDYLNWHLINKISQYKNKALMDGILTAIDMIKCLYSLQNRLIGIMCDNNTIYDEHGLYLEFNNIINENLKDIYLTLSDRKIEKRRITKTDEYPYECPAITDDIVDIVYQRFITEHIKNLDYEIQELIQSKGILADELALWESFMAQRQAIENSLSGKIKDVWAYNTKVWKLNRIRQLKNEFSCYGTMSELNYTLSLQDCNYTELMNYHSLSKACDDYEKGIIVNLSRLGFKESK